MKSIALVAGIAMAMTLAAAPSGSAGTGAKEQLLVEGSLCDVDVTPPDPLTGLRTAVVRGGPVSAGTPERPVTDIYLICSLQVGHPTHAGPDLARTTTWDVGTVTQAPVEVTVPAGDATLYSCSEIWVNTPLGHRSDVYDASTGRFAPATDTAVVCVAVGINTQFAGVVTVVTPDISGSCQYTGATTLTGQIQFMFGGGTTSYSTEPTSIQAVGTRATCTLMSPPQGIPGEPGLLSMSTDIRLSGSVAVTMPALTPPWPLRPVDICVSGDAQFGPAPRSVTLAEVCSPG